MPRGNGPSCRELSPFVIAAARIRPQIENEETHAHTIFLTPSEKEQLETILNAVANGHMDSIQEADVDEGTNRYRTRCGPIKDGQLQPPVDEAD